MKKLPASDLHEQYHKLVTAFHDAATAAAYIPAVYFWAGVHAQCKVVQNTAALLSPQED